MKKGGENKVRGENRGKKKTAGTGLEGKLRLGIGAAIKMCLSWGGAGK